MATLLSSLDAKIAWSHKAVVLLVAKQEGARLHFEQSQLVAVLLALVSRILAKCHSRSRDDELEALQSAEDFEALCMAYCVVLRICSSYRILSLLLRDALFSLSLSASSSSSRAWTATQLSHLRLHGLFVLGRLIELVPRRLVADGLVLRLCRFLVQHQRAIRRQVDCVSASLLRVLCKATRHLCAANSVSRQPVVAILGVADLHRVLLRILKHVSFEQALRCDAVLILAHLAAIRVGDESDAESETANRNLNPLQGEHAAEVVQTVCILLSSLPSIPLYDGLLRALLFCLRSLLRPRMAHNIAVFLREKGLSVLLRLLRKAQPAVAEGALNLMLQMARNQNVCAFAA